MPTPTILTGTLIANTLTGSYQNKGNVAAKAMTGNSADYFDGPTPDGNWVGLDMGAGKQFSVTAIAFAPRVGNTFSNRMIGGVFQGANKADWSDAVTIATIPVAPNGYTVRAPEVKTPFRYVRYLSPAGSSGNISRLSFAGVEYVAPPVAPPVTQPTTEVAVTGRGVNLRAVTDAASDPVAHPELVLIAGDYVRMWTENKTGKMGDPFPPGYFAIPQKWSALGKKVVVVIQYSGQTMPSDADFVAKITSVKGVYGVCLANELGGRGYPNFSLSQVDHLVDLAAPILKKNGVKLIAPSLINRLDFLQGLVDQGTISKCDFADYHSYEASAVNTLGNIDKAIAIVKPTGKSMIISEWGTRGSTTNIPGWAAEQKAVGIGLKTRPVIALQFPAYPLDGIAIGKPCPAGVDPLANYPAILGTSYQPNEPFYSAIAAALK